jgi:RNA polymerase sigma factor (TIGR02999 family)
MPLHNAVLFERLYTELRQLAHFKLRGSALTLMNTTALVHECFEKMERAGSIAATDRAQFLAYASRAMRSVLVDHARQRITARRGGGAAHLDLEAAEDQPAEDERIIRVHEALEELEARDLHLASVVEMRYFAGLTDAEIAEALDISTRTVRRHWQTARVLLVAAME